MKRTEVVKEIIRLVNEGIENEDYSKVSEAFRIGTDFNQDKEETEAIFMDEGLDYVMVDDDVFYFDANIF